MRVYEKDNERKLYFMKKSDKECFFEEDFSYS